MPRMSPEGRERYAQIQALDVAGRRIHVQGQKNAAGEKEYAELLLHIYYIKLAAMHQLPPRVRMERRYFRFLQNGKYRLPGLPRTNRDL